MKINLVFDSTTASAPSGFAAAMQQAVSIIEAVVRDRVTINIQVSYNPSGGSSFGGPSGAHGLTYQNLAYYLAASATSAADATALAHLPALTPGEPADQIYVPSALLKAWGLIDANATALDGSISISSSFTGNSLISAAIHEITHAMGRIEGVLDLFRYSSTSGQLAFTGFSGLATYFSIDGGVTRLADFGVQSDPWDFLNNALSANDPFAEIAPNSTPALTATDLTELDVLGFHLADSIAPTLSGLALIGANGRQAIDADIRIRFSEFVVAGTGNFVIHNANGSVFATIAAADTAKVAIFENMVALKPVAGLVAGASYYVTIDAGAVVDVSGNPVGAVASASQLAFTTLPQIVGTAAADALTGGAVSTEILGLAGLDTIRAGSAGDRIIGGGGGDNLYGGAGADVFAITDVADTPYQTRDTIINFQPGIDKLDLTAIDPAGTYFPISITTDGVSSDVFFAVDPVTFQYRDAVHFDHAVITPNDILIAELARPVVDATISASKAATITGGDGNDTLNGSNGADTLNGGLGDDTLAGYNGNDVLTGGGGRDTFAYYSNGFGADTITDFAAGDVIAFYGGLLSNFGQVQAYARQVGADTLIAIPRASGAESIRLLNVQASSLTASMFTFQQAAQFGSPSTVVLANFATQAGGWSSQASYPRLIADVNGDGLPDIVGFGQAGTLVSYGATSGSFSNPALVLADFGQANGWSSDVIFHRELADVNNDGRADIVGFGYAGVLVSLARADGTFAGPAFGLANFGTAQGWSSNDRYARVMADVNGDGKADIVGFGQVGTLVSLSNGDGTFQSPFLAIANFGVAQGWSSDTTYHRAVGDVNGDGKADIVGFGQAGVLVSLGNGDGTFAAPQLALGNFNPGNGWTSNDAFPRLVADINKDGRADIVGFGASATFLSYGLADGSFTSPVADVGNFTAAQGWSSQSIFPRAIADLNHDGLPDIVGFGAAGVYVGANQAGFLG